MLVALSEGQALLRLQNSSVYNTTVTLASDVQY